MNTEENKRIMADNIKRYMERKGVTNQQICADLGFKYTTFLDWTKGVTYPRIGKVEAMANYFGCEKSDLIEEHTQECEEMTKKGSTIADAVLRMKNEEEFLSVVEILLKMDAEQIRNTKEFLSIFLK